MRIHFLALGMLLALAATAAEPRGTVIERPVEEVARTLQARLPALASDGMCEAERQSNGWNFQFRLKADKTTAEEVQVVLRAAGAGKSELRVQGVRIEAAMITSKRMADPALSKEWTEKIVEIARQ